MLDLDTRVDFNEVVAVLLVDQELSGTGVAVVDRLGESDGICENSIAGLDGQILGRGNLNDLLVTALDRAVTLVEVDNVAVVVTEELDLNVLGLVKEALDKDGTVTESRLSLGSGTLKALLQRLGVANNTHTTTTTTVSSLDDDGETVLVSESLDLLVLGNSAFGTRNNRDVGSNGQLSGRNLVTKRVNDIGAGANELE